MIKIFLIDDEYLVLQDIKLLINWEEYGCKIVGEAQNVNDAIVEIGRLLPDLIISDIKMPFMTGLELCEKVKTISPYSKFVFLTAYADFEFAKKALSLGAIDYLLKPINKNELVQLINKYKEEFFDVKPLQVFYETVTAPGAASLKDIILAFPYLEFAESSYIYLCVTEQTDRNIKTVLSSVEGLRFIHDGAKKVFFVQSDTPLETTKIYNQLKDISSECQCCIGVSERIRNLAKMKNYYSHADRMSASNFIYKEHSVFLYKPPLGEFVDYLEKIKKVELRQELASLIAQLPELAKEKNFNYECIRLINREIETKMFQFGLKDENDLENEVFDLYSDLEEMCTSLVELCKYREKISLSDAGKSKIEEIVADMQKNYSKRIIISEYAKKFFYSENYLSQLFKKVIGVSFSNYLIDLRLSKAAELIGNSNSTLYEIADAVGYTDYFHFSKQFKKKYGVSPNSFRSEFIEKTE